ncbi:MAG: ABC transporter permease [Micromonosporaceae bacterium]
MTAGSQTAAAMPARSAGLGGLLLAEWTKIRSVRSTLWSLILLVVLTIGLTAAFVGITVASWSQVRGEGRAQILAEPAGTILGSGIQLSQLTICVLGVMVIASEYSTGVIRASLLAVPRRIPMLAAKGIVFAAIVFVLGEVVAFPSFLIGAAILHSKVAVSIGDPSVARAVFGMGLYLTVLGLFAMAIGALVRHTAGAITGVLAFVILLEPLAQLIPGSWGAHIYAYLPTVAGRMIMRATQHPDDLLSAWQGFGVFCLWTAALLAAASYFLVRRDA